MKINRLSAAFVAALIVPMVVVTSVLSACGGGGGDSSPAPVVVVTPTPVVPVVVTVTCSNGSTVSSAADCPIVPGVTPTPVVITITGSAVGTAPIALQGSVISPTTLDQGITIQFSGALEPSSVIILFKQGDSPLVSTWTIAGGDKDLTFKPTVRLAYSQSYTVVITAKDTIGRAVAVTLSFSTSGMTCSSNAVFSNPVPLSTVYQACVASIGVQALVTPSLNTMTDTSCVPTVGVPLTASCRAYMANGTILLADTSIVANNHNLMWMAYISVDGKSNLVLLDTTTMAPIGTTVLSGPLSWMIGNPTGVNVNVADVTLSAGLLRNEQITWNGASFTVTCHSNC